MRSMSYCPPLVLLSAVVVLALCSRLATGFMGLSKYRSHDRVAAFFSRTSLKMVGERLPEEPNEGLPRLSPNRNDLIRWIDASGTYD